MKSDYEQRIYNLLQTIELALIFGTTNKALPVKCGIKITSRGNGKITSYQIGNDARYTTYTSADHGQLLNVSLELHGKGGYIGECSFGFIEEFTLHVANILKNGGYNMTPYPFCNANYDFSNTNECNK